MKATGIVRKIDSLGRVVLPMELRNVKSLDEGTPMEIFVDGDNIILRKYEPSCVFCGESKDVVDFKDKKICRTCSGDLKRRTK